MHQIHISLSLVAITNWRTSNARNLWCQMDILQKLSLKFVDSTTFYQLSFSQLY